MRCCGDKIGHSIRGEFEDLCLLADPSMPDEFELDLSDHTSKEATERSNYLRRR